MGLTEALITRLTRMCLLKSHPQIQSWTLWSVTKAADSVDRPPASESKTIWVSMQRFTLYPTLSLWLISYKIKKETFSASVARLLLVSKLGDVSEGTLEIQDFLSFFFFLKLKMESKKEDLIANTSVVLNVPGTVVSPLLVLTQS